jgi:hypothetical protein
MSVKPSEFDSVQVLRVLLDPQGINVLYVVSGVAIVFFHGTLVGDWTRDTLTFLVPGAGSGNPRPLDFSGNKIEGTIVATAFPATLEYGGRGQNVGWGVDAVTAHRDGNNIRVDARIVARGPSTLLTRMGFSVQFYAVEP